MATELTFPGLEQRIREIQEGSEEEECECRQIGISDLEECMSDIRTAVADGTISNSILAELLDLRRRHKLAKIPEVFRILKENGKEKDPTFARMALILAMDELPSIKDCNVYDNLVFDDNLWRAFWRMAYDNPNEGQEINHNIRGKVTACDVGVFTMNLG